MDTIACKFGGACTANAAMLRRVRDIVEQDRRRRCIVLSAPGLDDRSPEKVTDALQRCWQCRDDPAARAACLQALCDRFTSIAADLGVVLEEDSIRSEIERALGVSRAHVLSRGEFLISRLFSRFSGIPMLDAADLIAFDSEGQLLLPLTLRRISEAARSTPRMIVPGFYGSAPDRRVVVFPRNGSDITGALIAAGVGAALYENWTDVPGVMTADPRSHPEARTIPELTYAKMRTMANAGASVLHPDCLAPVERAGIPTRIRWILHPELDGTLIRGQG